MYQRKHLLLNIYIWASLILRYTNISKDTAWAITLNVTLFTTLKTNLELTTACRITK